MTKLDEREKQLKENTKRNENYLKIFEKSLEEKQLIAKTIRKHVSNIDFYLNDYLTYYDEIIKMKDGTQYTGSFLGDWFIRKAMWASKSSIKEMSSSLKKFYEYMSALGFVKISDYQEMCYEIKDNMDLYLENLEDYDNGTFDFLF